MAKRSILAPLGAALCAAALAVQLPAATSAGSDLADVVALVDAGNFRAAESAIATALQRRSADAAERQAWHFERERMRRIRLDFPLSRSEMEAQLRKAVPDLRADELAAWDQPRLLEQLRIDGERRYFKSAVNNLFRIDAAAAARRATPLKPSDGPLYRLSPYHAEVRRLALASERRSVAPRRVRVSYSLSVDADAVPAGETVRAWLPFPRVLAGQQENLRLLASEPAQARIAPEAALQRTVYLEKPAVAGKPTQFSIDYELVTYATYVAIDAQQVQPARITPELAPFVAERAPHIVFSPALRRYSREIVGGEKNPYRIAQKLFAAVDRTPWAVAREYSTLSNISDYALHAGHADCGQQTLLLMALLRLNGIPARWQSGWEFGDGGFDSMHDWGWLYLQPYGWVPMDVTHGQLAAADPALQWFYLGGLDGDRIAFNDDYSREFVPPKQHFRSETVDLQRGEVEWKGGNLYFDQWDYRFSWQALPLQAEAPPQAALPPPALRHFHAGLEPAF
ncbi:transglutaminase-like putative cysteine protease [Tahibacter aquaticus]|uniref:Transglutaminase-like putative cysteine protease n=1 Tax=Tahibacter aquaticus TaxID=520092 RepID=A0A4R6YMR9_9GAMM|nr:transglutaminase domain-containing protein [Tahibacter aquaticus]TDR38758.1 transglutaminase-like putative cysteine protease [Tahibacter aquaticus]